MRAPLKFELDRRQGVLNIGYGAGSSPTFTNLTVTGVALFADGTAAAPSISFANSTNMGFFRYGPNDLGVSVLGATSFIIGSGGTLYGANGTARLTLPASGSVGLVAAGTDQNITLTPSGAGYTVLNGNVGIGTSTPTQGQLQISGNSDAGSGASRPRIALTNLAGAGVQWTIQSWSTSGDGNLRFYRSSGASGNYIFSDGRMLLGTLTDSGALLQVGANAATGFASAGMSFGGDVYLYRIAAGELEIRSGAGAEALLSLSQNGTQRGYIRTNGGGVEFRSTTANPLILSTNNLTALTLDASQNATFAGAISGTNITASTGAYYAWTAKSRIKSPSDGIVTLLNAAETDFTRLQFGGTTASFPSLGRSGTQIEVLLADGSAYAKIAAGSVSLRTAAANGGAGEVVVGSTTQTTVGAAGGASALPATPSGFLKFKIGTVDYVFPYYAA